jgi:hypothetical protein
MDPASLTDEIINSLLTCEKVIRSKRAKQTPKAKHKEQNLDVQSADGSQSFTLITRQSTMVADSYSCGLLWHATASHKVMLIRYNGSDHEHSNPIEGTLFDASCHIHLATERYISSGRKAEHYAEATTRYNDLKGAFDCLLADCNIRWTEPPANVNDAQTNLSF